MRIQFAHLVFPILRRGRQHQGAIIVPLSAASGYLNRYKIDVELGNEPIQFPIDVKGLEKPVDIRKGLFKKFRYGDVYYPIYNRNYREWRDKHNHGGDFMTYTKPRKIKLPKPIEFKLEEICRQPELM